MIEEEIWKVWKDTRHRSNGHIYEVSDAGMAKVDGVIIEFNDNSDDYYRLPCSDCLHRAVAELYVPNHDNKPCVDHIDGNKHNNRADNLRWVTYKENMHNNVTRHKLDKTCRSTECRKKNSETHKGQLLINLNGKVEKHVQESELDYWFSLGYVLGGKKRKKYRPRNKDV